MSTATDSLLEQVEKILRLAADNGATEVRLSDGAQPILRIGGQLRPLKTRTFSAAEVSAIAAAFADGARGRWAGEVVTVQGAAVLLLRPVAAGAPAADEPLELDTAGTAGDVSAEADAGAGPDDYAMPKAASGTIQIDKLLTAAVKGGVSDIHITAGLPPVFRVDGHMRPQPTKVLTADDTNGLMKAITPERCQAELAEHGGSDFGFAFKDLARFRVSVFKQRGSVAMVLRQIPNKLLTPEQLGVPEVCKRLVTRPRGLFLVTGPTGSGKSTTLASLIDYINQSYDHHIITIEDPIEFYHSSKKSTVNQREVGTDVPSFSEALRRALRQDPDVILVG